MRATGRINGVTDHEQELMKTYCMSGVPSNCLLWKKGVLMDSLMTQLVLKLITDNHDLQYRHRWKPDDIVIWDK
jgi:hypothetical protein